MTLELQDYDKCVVCNEQPVQQAYVMLIDVDVFTEVFTGRNVDLDQERY